MNVSAYGGTPGSGTVEVARARSPGLHVPAHERVVLDNGLTLLVVPRHDVPLVSFNALMAGGESAGDAGKAGLASLVAGLLEKGAGARDAFAFVDAVDGAGGTFHAGAGSEAVVIRGQFLARDQPLMLELLADALLRPQFKAEELDILRLRQIELIKAAKDSDPGELIGTYGRAFLFRAHPYARAVIGSEASLATIGQSDVLDYYRSHFGADRMILAIAGDVDSAWIQRCVSRAFGGWSRAPAPRLELPHPQRISERQVLLVDAPGSAQSHFWVGNVGVSRHYARRAALDLVNTLYGGRFTSMLNTELRVKSGLSYGARSGFTRGSVEGEFAIRSFAQTEDLSKALELALSTLAQLKRNSVSAEMLESARAYLLGQYPLDLETAADWAAALGDVELYGLGASYIEEYGARLREVSLQEARSVIDDAFPAPEAVAIVVIGDAAKLRGSLQGFGPLEEMPLTQPRFDSDSPARRSSHG